MPPPSSDKGGEQKKTVEAIVTGFLLKIAHVRNFHGKGFMPTVTSNGLLRINGKVQPTSDGKSYGRAVEEGIGLMRQLIEEDIVDQLNAGRAAKKAK